ncbi:MAG: single-stranded-DNA-specific exonuclease RecJ [Proteobacteria bacterium]|nr:single-stranded-DNA-specific exonuclease RecJ [Pseudomonadota bacterium]
MRPGESVEIPLPDLPRAQRSWKVRDSGDPGPLADALDVPPLIAQLLRNRGVHEADVGRLWLKGSLRDLPDPRVMHGMDDAVDRLLTAIRTQERICIHGDYDVDGCTSVAMLVHLLRRLGANVTWYAPHRVRDGYGVALHTVERLADEGVKVLVTCDTGVSAHAAIDAGNARGIDTIVCDHHTLPPELPAACAIVNPKIDGADGPYGELAAVGVSFMLAIALRARMRADGDFAEAPEPDLRDYLDIVALGTVADLAPLRGINRLLVQTGLKVLGSRKRPGLAALIDVSGIKPDEPLEASHLGFRLGPRINAAGRLAEAASAVQLMLAESEPGAKKIAVELDAYNRRRQETERRIHAEALQQIAGDPLLETRKGVVVWSDDWHPGVVGIVASRLMHHLHKPAIVLACKDDGTATGSGRGISGVDLFTALKRNEHLLMRFGGHRAAAGMTLKQENLEALREAFVHDAFADEADDLWTPRLKIDAELDLDDADWSLLEAIDGLAPFGLGNPQPLFVARGLIATDVKALSKGGIRMTLRQGNGPRYKAVGFGLGLAPEAFDGPIDAAFHLQVNWWQGLSNLELRLKDVKTPAM